jgi:hypothetical protein
MYSDVKQYIDAHDLKWYEIEESKTKVYDILIKKLKNKLVNLIS